MQEPAIELTVMSPASELGRRALWLYIEDVASRYYRRPATPDEVRAALRDDPSDELMSPTGVFVVACAGGTVAGCAGLRLLDDGVGEVKRMFVAASARGRGLGARLLQHLESVAREHGVARLRLDTRSDLVEARRLYARHGYLEVEPFNNGQYAEHWFAKSLV